MTNCRKSRRPGVVELLKMKIRLSAGEDESQKAENGVDAEAGRLKKEPSFLLICFQKLKEQYFNLTRRHSHSDIE